jgi:hypothetical protein
MAQVFVPLNRFQSVITNLTGEPDEVYVVPAGVSTIMLSMQITNTGLQTHPVTILINSNNNLPVPNFSNVYSGSTFISASTDIAYLSGSFSSASALLNLNRNFIKSEVTSYIQFLNNQSEEPFGYSASFYETNLLRDVDAIIYDIKNNTTIRTNKAAKAYYDKNGVSLIPTGQITASLNTVSYANTLAKQIIKNQSVTGSVSVSRLYQTAVTQSINTDYSVSDELLSGSTYLIDALYNIIKTNIEDPDLEAQPIVELIKNVEIPTGDSLSPVVAGKLVMEEGYSLYFSGSTELKVILSILESANE